MNASVNIIGRVALGWFLLFSSAGQSLAQSSQLEPAPAATALTSSEQPGSEQGSLVKGVSVTATRLLGNGGDELGIFDVSARASIFAPTSLDAIPFLILSPSFGVRFLDAPASVGLPNELYSASLTASWMHDWSDRTKLAIGVTGGVYSDFEATDGAFRITGHAFSTTQLNDKWEMMLGVVALNQNYIPVLPMAGFVYKPDADTRIELAAPRPRFAKRVTWFDDSDDANDWAYVSGEFGGGTYAVERPGGAEDEVNFRDFRLLVGFESKPATGLKTQFEIGYVFGRNVEFENDPTEFEPSDTVMLRAGLTY